MPELLNRRAFGSDGRTVWPVGLGTARLGAFWQRRSPRDAVRALTAALDSGVDLIDTADCYARGISERLVGRAALGRDVTVMTKVGLLKTPVALRDARKVGALGVGADVAASLGRGSAARRCFDPRYVETAVHRCLRRQRAERLDVLLLHEPTAGDLADLRAVDALDGLVARGDVGAWGASVRDADAASAAVQVPGLSVLQLPVSAADSSAVDRVREAASARGVVLVGIAALGDGTLLARARALRPTMTANDLVATLARAALAVPGPSAVLLGMSSEAHVRGVITALARDDDDRDDGLLEALREAVP